MRWKFRLKKRETLYTIFKADNVKIPELLQRNPLSPGGHRGNAPCAEGPACRTTVLPTLHPGGLLEQRGIVGPWLEESWLCYTQWLYLEQADQENWFRKEKRYQKNKQHVKNLTEKKD